MTISIDEAQQQLAALIESVSQSHQPIVISGQHGNAVLLSKSDWASVQETLYLLSVTGMRESIQAGDCDADRGMRSHYYNLDVALLTFRLLIWVLNLTNFVAANSDTMTASATYHCHSSCKKVYIRGRYTN